MTNRVDREPHPRRDKLNSVTEDPCTHQYKVVVARTNRSGARLPDVCVEVTPQEAESLRPGTIFSEIPPNIQQRIINGEEELPRGCLTGILSFFRVVK